MTFRTFSLCLSLVVSFAVLAAPARAVIGVSVKIADLFELSRDVLSGEVQEADSKARTLTLRVTEKMKGTSSAKSISLAFAEGVEVPAALTGQPAILFAGVKGTLIHVADGWLFAKTPADGATVWQVTRNDGATLDFPGRTPALLRVVADVRAGKRTIMNESEHVVFRGGLRKLTNILPQPKALATADVNGDGWEDVLVVGEEKAQLLLNDHGKLAEAPGVLAKAHGRWAAAGDANGDGRPDFFIGDTLWFNAPEGFKPSPCLAPMPEAKVLAAQIADATGDGLADMLLATETGEVIIFKNPGAKEAPWTRETKQLWSGGEPVLTAAFSKDWGDTGKPHLLAIRVSGPIRYALDADGGPPADHKRLAGMPPSWGGPWKIFGGTILDVDGNGLDDYYGSGPDFGAILNNRGFGTYLSNYSAKRVYGPSGLEWGKLTPATVLGAADLHCDTLDDVLVATEDGRLFEVDNNSVSVSY